MPVDFTAAIRRECALFRAALLDTDPATGVPTCPDWDADALLRHVGGVLWFWATIIEKRVTDLSAVEEDDRHQPADHAGLVHYLDGQVDRLTALLDQTADDVPVWTWSRHHTVGFIRRRMAQEALIHRIDAELTAQAAGSGVESPIDADLATDGVEETLTYFFHGPAWSTFTGDGPVGLLRTTDTGAQWLVQVGSVSGSSPDGQRSYDAEPAFRLIDDGGADHPSGGPPTFSIGAGAADLDAWLWRRPAQRYVSIEGSESDYAHFAAIVGEGID